MFDNQEFMNLFYNFLNNNQQLLQTLINPLKINNQQQQKQQQILNNISYQKNEIILDFKKNNFNEWFNYIKSILNHPYQDYFENESVQLPRVYEEEFFDFIMESTLSDWTKFLIRDYELFDNPRILIKKLLEIKEDFGEIYNVNTNTDNNYIEHDINLFQKNFIKDEQLNDKEEATQLNDEKLNKQKEMVQLKSESNKIITKTEDEIVVIKNNNINYYTYDIKDQKQNKTHSMRRRKRMDNNYDIGYNIFNYYDNNISKRTNYYIEVHNFTENSLYSWLSKNKRLKYKNYIDLMKFLKEPS